jgi:plastocyanin
MSNTIRSRGQLGLALGISLAIVLGSQASLAATHIVNQVGFTFDPPDITIEVGDTVQWVHNSGFHSVTSGTGAADPNSGLLFNEDPFSSGTFEFTFTSAGDVDYYCIPHELFGMIGVVRVVGVAAPVPMFPGGPALLIAALLAGALPWMRKLVRKRAAQ